MSHQILSKESKCFVVEHHHHVLSAWAHYRNASQEAPVLVTIDHHTDTSAAFRAELAGLPERDYESLKKTWLEEASFTRPQSIEVAIHRLRHDEHIQFAIDAGIISAAFVIAQNAMTTGVDVFNSHKICCYEVSEKDWDRIIESEFLDNALAHFKKISGEAGFSQWNEDRPIIFDIDLDAFKTKKSIRPDCSRTLSGLASQAGLVTIATEPDFVLNCAIESGVNSEFLLKELQSLLQLAKS